MGINAIKCSAKVQYIQPDTKEIKTAKGSCVDVYNEVKDLPDAEGFKIQFSENNGKTRLVAVWGNGIKPTEEQFEVAKIYLRRFLPPQEMDANPETKEVSENQNIEQPPVVDAIAAQPAPAENAPQD